MLSLFVANVASLAFSVAIPGLQGKPKTSNDDEVFLTKDVVTTVAVTGATGRTGRLVVEELLKRDVSRIVAVVRDESKAAEVFPNPPENLQIIQCDLTNAKDIGKALKDVDAAIWCATGFSDAQNSPLVKLQRLFNLAFTPRQSIDAVGIPSVASCLLDNQKSIIKQKTEFAFPKLVMLSSAGVTRTSWDENKRERFRGASDIPIVRLNPFNILDVKRESEEKLRASGIDYCIVRPCGLNDDWPAGSRPVFSQGDVAVGRINRKDVADVLVDVLSTPEATGKTFEAVGLAGYPKARSIRPALSRLLKDKDGPPSEDSIAMTYNTLQQLLPGEKQDSASLAMGQTYEQLDRGETGRLGKRGEEDAAAAAPKPSS